MSAVNGMGIYFEVLGLPAPQGSKTRMPNGAMLDGASKGAREKHGNWRSAVAAAARNTVVEDNMTAPLDAPLHVTLWFRFPMPKSRPASVRGRGRAWKPTTPDLDKIVRATLDGLTAGGLIADDRYVVKLDTHKMEVIGWTGCEVTIDVLDGAA